jgi:hypothetical protein
MGGLGQGQSRTFVYSEAQMQALQVTLSAPRLGTYLSHAQGDMREAVRLYEANTILSEALYSVLQGFEVAARNSMHSAMKRGTGHDAWYNRVTLKDPEMESVESAERKIVRAGKTISPDRVVSELSFGFWVALCARHYASALWLPYLNKAFPHASLGHKAAHQRLNSIRLLRNRVAHHECILSRNLENEYRDILEATAWICTDTAMWVRETNRFEVAFMQHSKRPLQPLRA